MFLTDDFFFVPCSKDRDQTIICHGLSRNGPLEFVSKVVELSNRKAYT